MEDGAGQAVAPLLPVELHENASAVDGIVHVLQQVNGLRHSAKFGDRAAKPGGTSTRMENANELRGARRRVGGLFCPLHMKRERSSHAEAGAFESEVVAVVHGAGYGALRLSRRRGRWRRDRRRGGGGTGRNWKIVAGEVLKGSYDQLKDVASEVGVEYRGGAQPSFSSMALPSLLPSASTAARWWAWSSGSASKAQCTRRASRSLCARCEGTLARHKRAHRPSLPTSWVDRNDDPERRHRRSNGNIAARQRWERKHRPARVAVASARRPSQSTSESIDEP